MEVHPVSGHIGSFKEAAIHIGIVTIGILIALGLDGLREEWREHVAVNDARASFRGNCVSTTTNWHSKENPCRRWMPMQTKSSRRCRILARLPTTFASARPLCRLASTFFEQQPGSRPCPAVHWPTWTERN